MVKGASCSPHQIQHHPRDNDLCHFMTRVYVCREQQQVLNEHMLFTLAFPKSQQRWNRRPLRALSRCAGTSGASLPNARAPLQAAHLALAVPQCLRCARDGAKDERRLSRRGIPHTNCPIV
jgi:hypothetical protein